MSDTGAIDAGVHRIRIRVYYEDTDAAGIVYHAAYLEFAERARTEMLRCLGLDHGTLRERFGLMFTVRRCVVDYRAPARLDDLLEIRTRLVRLGGASLDLEQLVLRAPELLTRLDVRLALLGADLRVARVPRDLVGAFDRLRARRNKRSVTSLREVDPAVLDKQQVGGFRCGWNRPEQSNFLVTERSLPMW